MFTLLLALTAAGSSPEPLRPSKDDNIITRGAAYQDCVNEHGVRWATTDAPIETIIRTAFEACEAERIRLQQMLAVSLENIPKKKRPAYYQAWMEGTDAGISKALTQLILDARSKKD